MSRADELEDLQGKLREGHIFDCRDELEDFLSKDIDEFTGLLQKTIDDKLENPGFYHRSFSDFLNDYYHNHPDDQSGYSTMCSEIGEDDDGDGDDDDGDDDDDDDGDDDDAMDAVVSGTGPV